MQLIWLEFGVEYQTSRLVGPPRDVRVRSVPILVICRVNILQSLFVLREVSRQGGLREGASAPREVLAAFVGY